MRLSLQALLGRRIVSQDDVPIGECIGLDIALDDWSVVGLEVRLERSALEALQIRRPLLGTVTVQLQAHRLRIRGGFLVLNSRIGDTEIEGIHDGDRERPDRNLLVLALGDAGTRARDGLTSDEAAKKLGWSAVRLNAAVEAAEQASLVVAVPGRGHFPYPFGRVRLSSDGKQRYRLMRSADKQ